MKEREEAGEGVGRIVDQQQVAPLSLLLVALDGRRQRRGEEERPAPLAPPARGSGRG